MTSSWTGCNRLPQQQPKWPPEAACLSDQIPTRTFEEVYLHAYETVSAAREGIGRYIVFYNTRRPHSSHAARTPDVVYFASLHQPSADAA